MKNALGREIPENIAGVAEVKVFAGAFDTPPNMRRQAPKVKSIRPTDSKMVDSLAEVFAKIPVTDGMTLSFHHHFRNGDGVVNMVLATAAKLGLKNLKVALSSVFPVHAPLIEHAKNGVVT